jgi:FlaG/FlaF family flagellin (archaellin)
MNERRLIVRMGIVVALAALANSAFASLQVEEETATYGSSQSPLAIGSSLSLNIPQFNAENGTLTGVSIQLSSYDTISSLVFNATPNIEGYTGATATMPVTVTAPDGLSTMATGIAGPFEGNANPYVLTVAGTKSAGAITAEDSINSGNFSLFETGGNDAGTFTVTVGPLGSYFGSAGSFVFFGGNGSSYGTVEFDYTYEPTDDPPKITNDADAVPEPATLCAGLAVTSICGIELARRFRRVPARA